MCNKKIIHKTAKIKIGGPLNEPPPWKKIGKKNLVLAKEIFWFFAKWQKTKKIILPKPIFFANFFQGGGSFSGHPILIFAVLWMIFFVAQLYNLKSMFSLNFFKRFVYSLYITFHFACFAVFSRSIETMAAHRSEAWNFKKKC